MSTVNFSVPEDVKNAFNTVFEGQNKSAVIADLMRDAVEREQRRKQHCSAVDRILANRINAPRLSEAEFNAARDEGRPRSVSSTPAWLSSGLRRATGRCVKTILSPRLRS